MVYGSIVSEITGALAADEQFDKLSQYITELLKLRNTNYLNMDFLYLMALEFTQGDLAEVALNALKNNVDVIKCAQHLGFHQAYLLLIDVLEWTLEYSNTDFGHCAAEYGAYGMIRLIPSPNSEDDKYPSVSFRVLRSALPKGHALPKLAFEDKTVVEKMLKWSDSGGWTGS
ncbi:hypothetical protein BJ085DRAFT_34184 [Dimargaris cristalligena]|uniref:Uncharacterized protein n=1 Tax=Dimargaris cristalligena TaxID=215637 RepID=A0A4Q0A0U4_9FUNG|nr:hypothetical protein BJ085DRAFT_34184 [Dimargaris cristalligena]|eukprot:RKP38740.1 hypothetical protein BJ085DRAFT_34184 [Dimargaris cristalligena]